MAYTILYIEDNPNNTRLIRRMLSHSEYHLLEAETGLDGLAIAERERPDLILMDINLPDIDGLETTRRLKNDPFLADIPVIALTSNVMSRDRQDALNAGCDGYLTKPINRVELLWTLNDTLDAQPLTRADLHRALCM